MSAVLVPVIICGGSGSRLWPVSRHSMPKPFHMLLGQHNLYQQTLLRAQALSTQAPIVVTHQDY